MQITLSGGGKLQNPLIVNVEKLRVQPLHMELEMEPSALDLADPEFTFQPPVKVLVDFNLVGQDVLAHGAVSVGLETPCVRCLTPTRVDLRVPVDETWLRGGTQQEPGPEAEEEPLVHEYHGDEIDTTEVLRELVMSELPDRTLCRENCRGLCPGCGANLNDEACRCAGGGSEPAPEEKLPEWKKALKNIKLPE